MNKCSAILKKTNLHESEECPHTGIDGWEHEGNYYCIFHMPEESKIRPRLESYPSIHEKFLKHFQFHLKSRDKENQKESPEKYIPIDCRGFIFPIKIELDQILKTIHGSVDFSNSIFLQSLTVSTLTINGVAIFERVEFKKEVYFGNLQIPGENGASFKNSTFFDDVTFHEGQIGKTANFEDVTFIGNTKFHRITMCQVNLNNAQFDKNIEFQTVTFREITKIEGTIFGCEKHKEEIYINFFGSVFEGEVYFDNAQFNGRLNLDSVVFRNFVGFRKASFYVAPTIVNTKIEENLDFSKAKFKRGNIYTYRKIKKWMEEQRNMWEATMFYGRELLEERRDFKWYWWCLSLNTAYLIFNNYGRWWLLPIFWIIIVTAFFAAGYCIFDSFGILDVADLLGWEKDIDNYPKILRSLLFSTQQLKLSWLFGRQILFPHTGWVWIANGIQSVINIVLFAMTIISIRKKFKI